MVNGLFECLQEANLAQYKETFLQHGVCSLEALSSLTIQDYSQFGITSLADKKRLFCLIHIVRSVQASKLKTVQQDCMAPTCTDSQKLKRSPHLQQAVNHDDGLVGSRRDACSTCTEEVLHVEGACSVPDAADKFPGKPSEGNAFNESKQVADNKRTGLKNLHSIVRKELKKGVLSPGTLRKLETKGGILFVKPSCTSSKIHASPWTKLSTRRKLLLRKSLSDSEVTDSDATDSMTVASERLNFGRPKIIKKSFIQVIDHRDSDGYNYGIPLQEQNSSTCQQHHSLHKTPQVNKTEEAERIRVCIRKRPLNKKEERENEMDVVQMEGRGTVVMNEAKIAVDLTKFIQVHKYHFDEVFSKSSSNEEVYARTAKPLISTMFNSGKATCFAYGQTGAGKTYTMLGNGDNVKGLYLLAAQDIFATLNSSKRLPGDELHVTVWASYFEIYCGQLFDLLNNRQRVHAREDSHHRVCITGISEVQVSGPQILMRIVQQGNGLRSKGVSGVNADSSRSHAILQLQLQDGGRHKLGRFSFIDLAGSERACDTVGPDRLTRYEGAEINTSLLALKECIRALDQDQRHTPFRQSKLTQVLRDSFLGQSKTCMIANIAPNSSAVDHTLNTLRYADRVKELKKETLSRPTSSPYPSTPSTFSPSTTSTPLKTPNKKMEAHQTQTTTPNGHLKSHPRSKVTPVRKMVSEKTSIKSGDFNMKRNVSQENRKNLESSANNKSMPKISNAKTHRQVSLKRSSVKKSLDVTFESPKSSSDTPSKRNEALKSQTKEAFLHGKVLPVWYPPEETEPSKAVARTPGEAWEIDNPRYTHSPKVQRALKTSSSVNENTPMEGAANSPPVNKTETSIKMLGESHISVSEQHSVDPESGFSADDEMTETWSRINNSSSVKQSLQSYRSETSCSTDTNSTIELLAEIDYALRNSLVSPVSDDGLGDSQQSNDQPTYGISERVDGEPPKSSERQRTRATCMPQEEHCSEDEKLASVTRVRKESKKETHQHPVSLYPKIYVSKSPDSMSPDSLQDTETERHRFSQKQIGRKTECSGPKTDQIRVPVECSDPRPSKSSRTFPKSKLKVQGIEILPSPKDIQQVTSQSFGEQMEEVAGHKHGPSNPSAKKEQYDRSSECSSGVIVSTSFCEYVSSNKMQQNAHSGSSSAQVHVTPETVRLAPVGHAATFGKSISLQSPFSPEVLQTDQRCSAFSAVPDSTRSFIPSSGMSKTPSKAFTKECFSNNSCVQQTQLNAAPWQSTIFKEILNQHPAKTPQDHPYSQKTQQDTSDGTTIQGSRSEHSPGSTEGQVPRLHLSDSTTDIRTSLLSPRQNSAIEKAKELLVSAHAEQIDELERLCEREWKLINQLHSGEKGLSEYLHHAKGLMNSKLRCIDTFQDQLSTFSRCSTPEVSPRSRSPMEAW